MRSEGFAVLKPGGSFTRFNFERRDLGAEDILIDIDFAGICHSDIHQVHQEWGPARFPMIPGHEIVGRVSAKGQEVSKFDLGDLAGVGVYINSCKECPSCKQGLTQYCDRGIVETYNSIDQDGTLTFGGYSKNYVLNQNYAVKIPSNLDLPAVAPLLCAGITLYSPLQHWKIGPGSQVAILGMGGLGHMGVKLAHALGANVTVISHSPKKSEDALRMGAKEFINYEDLAAQRRRYDLILNTVSAPIEITPVINSLKVEGTLVAIGVPSSPYQIHAGALIGGRKSFAGSMIGSVEELQVMLDFCGEHSLVSEIELIQPDYINQAYQRTIASDVKYRFVIDIKSWREGLSK